MVSPHQPHVYNLRPEELLAESARERFLAQAAHERLIAGARPASPPPRGAFLASPTHFLVLAAVAITGWIAALM